MSKSRLTKYNRKNSHNQDYRPPRKNGPHIGAVSVPSNRFTGGPLNIKEKLQKAEERKDNKKVLTDEQERANFHKNNKGLSNEEPVNIKTSFPSKRGKYGNKVEFPEMGTLAYQATLLPGYGKLFGYK
tara:strand:- start:23 stop:406 length:384 start_codon:yes stop_codon:yes gene_type:complete